MNESVVADRWQAEGDGAHYESGRWKSSRARGRDGRLVARLLQRAAAAGAPIQSVLDVPCGTGRLRDDTLGALRSLRPDAAIQWCGSDISPSMLEATPEPGNDLVRGSALALPFADRSFDVVLCCRLLHHLEEPTSRATVIGELTRVASRYVIASYWDRASYGAWRRRTNGPLRRRRPAAGRQAMDWDEIASALERSGARVVARAFSMRFVSQQAFFLAEISR